TLDPLPAVSVPQNGPTQTVALAGISSGAPNETQTLTVLAASSNTSIIPNPTIFYTSPNASGTLTFAPVASATGTATVTVTVDDGDTVNNLFSQTFVVSVVAAG